MKRILIILLLSPLIGFGQSATIRPSGSGTYSDMTPSTGTDWGCVDESSANDDTDYIISTFSGAYSSFTHTDAGLTGSETITSLSIFIRAKRTSVSDGANIRTLLIISGNEYDDFVSNLSYSTSYTTYEKVIALNPNTGTAWTKAVIDAMQIGMIGNYEYVDGDGELRVTQLYAVITYTGGGGGGGTFSTKLLLQGTGK